MSHIFKLLCGSIIILSMIGLGLYAAEDDTGFGKDPKSQDQGTIKNVGDKCMVYLRAQHPRGGFYIKNADGSWRYWDFADPYPLAPQQEITIGATLTVGTAYGNLGIVAVSEDPENPWPTIDYTADLVKFSWLSFCATGRKLVNSWNTAAVHVTCNPGSQKNLSLKAVNPDPNSGNDEWCR